MIGARDRGNDMVCLRQAGEPWLTLQALTMAQRALVLALCAAMLHGLPRARAQGRAPLRVSFGQTSHVNQCWRALAASL